MQCGLFGKLPAKRDFVAYNMPRPFLDAWENWLQSTIAESRHALAENWKDIYLTLPIWRFWCGSSVFGQAVTGAVMASVDGVGRYFPLSICACETNGDVLVPPPEPQLAGWLDRCENALLGLLDDQTLFDPQRLLDELGTPPFRAEAAAVGGSTSLRNWTAAGVDLAQAFESMAASDTIAQLRHRSMWWTLGGHNHAEQLITTEGIAPPSLFSILMTGISRA